MRKRDGRELMGGDGVGGLDSAWVRAVQAGLVEWYRLGHRALPWRRDRDPYRIMVSEFMLVQTTAATAAHYFDRFLERFPTVEALASAAEEEVLRVWEGLGYYRRARQLLAAARAIVLNHGGEVPRDRASLEALPGMGRYIAGAVLSFAFDLPEPILEANSRRVLARLIGFRELIGSARGQARLWEVSTAVVPAGGGAEFNQALIELGATICKAREPLCLVCPVRGACRAHADGATDSIPMSAERPRQKAVVEACVLMEREGGWLMAKRPTSGLWEGFWEWPTVHLEGADPAGRGFGQGDLASSIAQLTGVRPGELMAEGTVSYVVTRHKVRLGVFRAVSPEGVARANWGNGELAWLGREELESRPLTSISRRILRAFGRG